MTNKEDGSRQFYVCNCFTTDNIFLEDYKLHVRFLSEQQFRLDYQSTLRRLGCVTDQQFEDVLNKISQEVDRRRRLSVTSAERAVAIKDTYQPLHPNVYHLQESFLAPKFKQIVEYCRSSNISEECLGDLLEEEAAARVYRFPVFEKSFCEELVEELEHFEKSSAPKGRPNTMNHYGILLNELGFDEGFITPLRELYLHPLTSRLYPDCGGRCLDSHKAFVVKYDMNEDLDLSYHYDNAEVTLNVSLGKDFTEGNLYFGDMRQVPLSEMECSEVQHRVTEGLLHRGQHMHGALPISSGQRWNLIIWMRASQERNKLCPMCNRRPMLVEGEGFADGFTKHSDALLNTSCVMT
ncbi:2-oxoglutarate and iron-dependent oxygenase domain-containing protein 2 [Anoplopoma fimbria]|uniref:2-oxoglutarate and iron-dependent oxygenase domain-containing protein 2 n=1 Tax=Anoplopoma fimbria TaxID=229290 RepID=UPI0023EAF632|nr:2-oxoglutarate and iron-dependent oxygenase domain-containing protein 2 [Anoplopoma fimbria]